MEFPPGISDCETSAVHAGGGSNCSMNRLEPFSRSAVTFRFALPAYLALRRTAPAKYSNQMPMLGNRWKSFCIYTAFGLGLIGASVVIIEIYLSYQSAPRSPLPFYNRLYPFVMFRPNGSYTYETTETYEMSQYKSRVFVYSNEDGFRVPSPGFRLPKHKPDGQLRIAFLGSSSVQLASTFDLTLPGSLKTLLQRRYPDRDIEVVNAGIQSCISRQS